jgi:hypothetical protein
MQHAQFLVARGAQITAFTSAAEAAAGPAFRSCWNLHEETIGGWGREV